MSKSGWGFLRGGAWLVALAAVAGFAVSVANYFNPQSGIAGEPGTILVIASTALLAVFGWLMSGHGWRGVFFRIFIIVSSLLNIAGTGFAGYLLHSWVLLARSCSSVFLAGFFTCSGAAARRPDPQAFAMGDAS